MYIYFRVDKGQLAPGDYAAEAEVEYLDDAGSFLIEYDSALGDNIDECFWDSERVGLRGTGQWQHAVIPLPRAHFGGRQNLEADLRISGRVLVRSIALRPLAPQSTVRTEQATLTWRCDGGTLAHEFSTVAPVLVARIAEAPPDPAGLAQGKPKCWALSPYGTAVPEFPVEVPPERLPEDLRSATIGFIDCKLGHWPLELRGGRLRGVALLDPMHPLFVAPTLPDVLLLSVRDHAEELGYVAVQNRYLGALWDARRGGCLMSLMDMGRKHDYAAPYAGACTVEYTLPDRRHEVSSTWPGEVRVEAESPVGAEIVATAEGPHLQVEDRWHVYAAARLMRLERTITFTHDLAAADFCPLVLRLDPEHFAETLPLGVGFQNEGEPKRGWLETWHSEGWYFAFGGDAHAAADAVALVVSQADRLRRVWYGFAPGAELAEASDPRGQPLPPDELQIRLRSQGDYTAALPWLEPGLELPTGWDPPARGAYEPGDQLVVRATIAVARGCSWRYARELGLLEKFGPAVSVSDEPPVEVAVAKLMAPLYMYRVHPPYPSAAIRIDRQPGLAPEVWTYAQ